MGSISLKPDAASARHVGGSVSQPGARLTGFDLFRGLAAFAVISMHAGMVNNSGLTAGAARYDAVCDFAVPFFLLASFYFNARSLKADVHLGTGIRKRAGRLLVPYAAWTLVYVGLKVAKPLLQHQPLHLRTLFADPVGVFLLGGSGVQLYFLPLLFVGLVVQLCLAPSARRWTNTALWLGFALAAAVNAWMILSGNAFDLSDNRAFQCSVHMSTNGLIGGTARLLLAAVTHALRCLPLILLAFLLLRYQSLLAGRRALIASCLLGAVVLLVPLSHRLAFPIEIGDETLSVAAFLVAWSLSSVIPRSDILTRIGAYSFGIYLCHQVFLELLQVAFKRQGAAPHPQGLSFTLGVSALVFGASWLTVALASRCGPAVGTAFGLELPKPQAA